LGGFLRTWSLRVCIWVGVFAHLMMWSEVVFVRMLHSACCLFLQVLGTQLLCEGEWSMHSENSAEVFVEVLTCRLIYLCRRSISQPCKLPGWSHYSLLGALCLWQYAFNSKMSAYVYTMNSQFRWYPWTDGVYRASFREYRAACASGDRSQVYFSVRWISDLTILAVPPQL
jgi:hypothetical protein